MNKQDAHLCVTKDSLIRPENIYNARWITKEDSKAFAEPFSKNQDHGWTLEEFCDLMSQGYSYCGIFIEERLNSIAGLWKRENDVWEVIAVGTREEYRCQGMAKSVVYFIADHILQHVSVASYTANIKNIASIRTAQSVGFQLCTNIVNNDKWCANNPRPNIQNPKCPLF